MIIGTQEIMLLLMLAIPIAGIFLLVRFFKNWRRQTRKASTIHTAAEIEKLFALKEKGVITQQEFDSRKSLLLHQ
jgi:hypothetical protein